MRGSLRIRAFCQGDVTARAESPTHFTRLLGPSVCAVSFILAIGSGRGSLTILPRGRGIFVRYTAVFYGMVEVASGPGITGLSSGAALSFWDAPRGEVGRRPARSGFLRRARRAGGVGPSWGTGGSGEPRLELPHIPTCADQVAHRGGSSNRGSVESHGANPGPAPVLSCRRGAVGTSPTQVF